MRKHITTWVLIVVLAVSLLPGAALAAGFTDVPADAYYADPVNWAVENNITRGTSESSFSPENTCTRGQVVTFLWRSAGEPEPQLSGAAFQDVNTDDYCGKAVQWAVENDITKGTSATTFSPEQGCTRGQVVTFLHRSENEPLVSGTKTFSFSDVLTNDYFFDAVKWAVEQNITNGTSDSTFSPNATCTRAQIVTFLYRLYKDSLKPVSGKLTGFVKDQAANQPLADVQVTLTMEGLTLTATTDETGKFHFPIVLEGKCKLAFSKDGYEPTTNGASISAGVETVLLDDIYMKKVNSWLRPYQLIRGWECLSERNETFVMSGKTYTDGFVLNPGTGTNYNAEALFNLEGKYTSMSCRIGHIDRSYNYNVTMNVYLDGELSFTRELKYDDVAKTVTIPLNHAEGMKIELTYQDSANTNYGFAEIVFS